MLRRRETRRGISTGRQDGRTAAVSRRACHSALMADDVGPGTPKPWTGYLLRAESLHVLDGVLYAGGDRLAAFEATTGRTLWTRGSGRILSTAGERYLYVDCRDGTITAINRLTGEDVWSRTRPRWLRGPRP